MYRKNLDLVATVSIAIVDILLTLLPVHVKIMQLLIALPLVFFVPGYLITEALFQKRQTALRLQTASFLSPGVPRPLDIWEYITYGIGLSIAIDIVGGFLLNLIPIGLVTVSWTALLGMLAIVFSLVVATQRFYRRRWDVGSTSQVLRIRLSLMQVSLFGAAGVIVVLAVLFSINSAQQQPYPGFTQFWMTPVRQNSCKVQLGIRNFEGTSMTYRVNMEVNGTTLKTWIPIVLDAQQQWSQLVPITLPSTKLTKNVEVEALLYRIDRADKASVVYRQVHMQLPISGDSLNGKILQCGNS